MYQNKIGNASKIFLPISVEKNGSKKFFDVSKRAALRIKSSSFDSSFSVLEILERQRGITARIFKDTKIKTVTTETSLKIFAVSDPVCFLENHKTL